METFACL